MTELLPQSISGRPRIVIVTPMHLSANPRVVKEADALAMGGFDVHVVFAQRSAGIARMHDAALVHGRLWRATAVCSARTRGEYGRWLFGRSRQRLSQIVPARLWRLGHAAEYSSGRVLPMLSHAAAKLRADLYIGHYAEGLAAAGIAAQETGGMLGFDAEDFHTGEANSPDELARTDFIQERYLERCRWVTAASAGFSEALTKRYNIPLPVTINNVFPFADRAAMDGLRRDRHRDDILSLYWYSQVIGLDRGIQDLIRAGGQLGGPVEIHLRGRLENEVREVILSLARECGVQEALFFHTPISPQELLSRAAEHDVGLALEPPVTVNRTLAASNKLFMYYLAGIAIAGTSTPGQIRVFKDTPEAAAWYSAGDVAALASILERWRTDRVALVRAKAAALESARSRWNWEKESQILVDYARSLFGSRAPEPSSVTGEEISVA